MRVEFTPLQVDIDSSHPRYVPVVYEATGDGKNADPKLRAAMRACAPHQLAARDARMSSGADDAVDGGALGTASGSASISTSVSASRAGSLGDDPSRDRYLRALGTATEEWSTFEKEVSSSSKSCIARHSLRKPRRRRCARWARRSDPPRGVPQRTRWWRCARRRTAGSAVAPRRCWTTRSAASANCSANYRRYRRV